MVIDLKMCRFESAPWGFRLIGGADFEVPLTVVKVTEGSIAEQAGMKVGDIIVRINDEPTSNMTHTDAHHVISKCGNNFFFGILREEETEAAEYCEELQVCEQPADSVTDTSAVESKEELVETVSCEAQIQISESDQHEGNVTEEEIADMMSGEAEVLKEHNVIGIFPKAGVCQSSEVFRHLNEEAVKTKIEMEKEKRKWTTFLQRPDRPVPKDKKMLEEQPQSEPYKVRIVKQPKPKVDPDRAPTPPPEPEPEQESAKEVIAAEEIKLEEELAEPPTDSEVPNLESDTKKADDNGEQIKTDEECTIETVNNVEETSAENKQNDDQEKDMGTIEVAKVEKTEEELVLEKQLSDVQKQLLALSSLPSTIQATLDSVTKQLAELLPTFKLQPPLNINIAADSEEKELTQEEAPIAESSGGQQNTDTSCEEHVEEKQDDIITTEEIEETNELSQITSANVITDDEKKQPEVRPTSPTPEEIEQKQSKEDQRKMQEELQYKKQKEQHEQLKEELQQRLIRDRPSRRPPRAFGPLTPQERPLVLPGGRKWRKPKDAYNDEFIAEILSSQAELIVGTTLGVNFLKYQKPEKKIDLEKSEVYKVIHRLEREPKRGIQARPPKVLAEEDVRTRATPMSCG